MGLLDVPLPAGCGKPWTVEETPLPVNEWAQEELTNEGWSGLTSETHHLRKRVDHSVSMQHWKMGIEGERVMLEDTQLCIV